MENETPQVMTYKEREHLKECIPFFGDEARHVLTMIAHWHRQSTPVSFTRYAANWAAAQTQRGCSTLRQAWPLEGPRMIQDGCSDWNSYMKSGHQKANLGMKVEHSNRSELPKHEQFRASPIGDGTACCGNCEYYWSEGSTEEDGCDIGDCRRHAPTIGYPTDPESYYFPTIAWFRWCGDFRERHK